MARGQASQRRLVSCPYCETQLDVSRNAKSTLCPGCHKNIHIEDEKIKTYCARRECFTEGTLTVAKKGVLIAEVRARALEVEGEVKGPVRARESVEIKKTGRVFGPLTAPTLRMDLGGQLVGRCEFGPHVAELRKALASAPSDVEGPAPTKIEGPAPTPLPRNVALHSSGA